MKALLLPSLLPLWIFEWSVHWISFWLLYWNLKALKTARPGFERLIWHLFYTSNIVMPYLEIVTMKTLNKSLSSALFALWSLWSPVHLIAKKNSAVWPLRSCERLLRENMMIHFLIQSETCLQNFKIWRLVTIIKTILM